MGKMVSSLYFRMDFAILKIAFKQYKSRGGNEECRRSGTFLTG